MNRRDLLRGLLAGCGVAVLRGEAGAGPENVRWAYDGVSIFCNPQGEKHWLDPAVLPSFKDFAAFVLELDLKDGYGRAWIECLTARAGQYPTIEAIPAGKPKR